MAVTNHRRFRELSGSQRDNVLKGIFEYSFSFNIEYKIYVGISELMKTPVQNHRQNTYKPRVVTGKRGRTVYQRKSPVKLTSERSLDISINRGLEKSTVALSDEDKIKTRRFVYYMYA